jgi:hypothetical protein
VRVALELSLRKWRQAGKGDKSLQRYMRALLKAEREWEISHGKRSDRRG